MSRTARIDDREVRPEPDETILDAARRSGIEIPTLCAATGVRPEGGCRLCVVEIEGARRPLAACHTALAPGMRVRTRSDALAALRREILALHLASYPLRAVPERSELAALLAEHGLPRPDGAPDRARLDDSSPYLRFNPDLCIVCRRCVRACDEILAVLERRRAPPSGA